MENNNSIPFIGSWEESNKLTHLKCLAPDLASSICQVNMKISIVVSVVVKIDICVMIIAGGLLPLTAEI